MHLPSQTNSSGTPPWKAFGFLLIFGAVFGPRTVQADNPTFDGVIGAIFKAKCQKCHGGFLPQKGLKLNSLKNVLKGGQSGAVVIPGKPDSSILYRQFSLPITDPKRMPPAVEKNELTAAEKKNIRDWIASGAK
jgi:hypothetical protein